MDRKCLAWMLVSVVLSTAWFADAQQPTKTVARIGVLATGKLFLSRFKAFQQGFQALGYIEGKDFVYEYRNAELKYERLPQLAAELVQAKVDVIFTASAEGVSAAKNATKTIPIVFGTVQDPLASGLVESLARPGGNITGMSAMAPDLSGKRLEILKEVAPRATTVAYFWSSASPGSQANMKDTLAAAKALKLRLHSMEVREQKDIESALEAVLKQRALAISTAPDPVINNARQLFVPFVRKHRLPAMYAAPEFAENDGLMAYAPNYDDMWRRAASHVDKILKGTKPADLPVEQPIKFEFIVNLKSAKQISLTIPPEVLARASKIIR